MVADLAAPGSRTDAVFVVGCGVGCGADALAIKAALEAGTGLNALVPGGPHMALVPGAALASANAPLFAWSTGALEDFAAHDRASIRGRRPFVLAGSALAAVAAGGGGGLLAAAGLVLFPLPWDGRVPPAAHPTPRAAAPSAPSPPQPAPEAAASPVPPP